MRQTTDDRRRMTPGRLLFLSSVVCCLSFLPLLTHAYTFSRDLSLGDTGEDVRALQTSLNADSRTRVAETGPGSPGNETDFFGDKTQSAVIRYQNLYADEILRPLGIAAGTGYVGAATRQHLGGIGGVTAAGQNDRSQAIADFDTALARLSHSDAGRVSNGNIDVRNEQSKELFLSMVRSALDSSDVPQDEIDVIVESIEDQSKKPLVDVVDEFIEGRSRFDTATRTAEQIIYDAKTIAPFPHEQSSGFGRLFGWLDALNPVFPPKAQAQILQPVGGLVLYSYLCTCTFTWLIALGPPSIGLVDYETGTQGFASYNLPYARYLLGHATRFPVCYIYTGNSCLPIVSTYGLLSPIVGSSLI